VCRWIVCRGSVLSKGVDAHEDEDTDAAEEGVDGRSTGLDALTL
jgi:hypothetical protein